MKGKWLSILMLLCAISLSALIPPEAAIIPLPTDPDLVSGTLANGLNYYILRNAKPENRIELRLLVEAGSVNEDDDQRGLAHVVEHMAFNGSKNFPRTEMVEYLSSIGMDFHNGLNGGTSYDYTVYQFKLPTEDEPKLRKGLSILSDIAWQVSFDPSEIDRERGIIEEEWRMGQSADQRVRDKIDMVRFADSRYAVRNPIGTIENIRTFKHDSLIRYYRDWYRPDLQHVIIVGDYDPQILKTMVEEYFGVIPVRENPRQKERYPVPDNLQPRAITVLDKEMAYSYAMATWKKEAMPKVNLGDYYEDMKQDLFYSMFNARMQELTLQPDSPITYGYGFNLGMLKEFSAATFMAFIAENRSEAAIDALFTEITRISKYGFQPAEFDRAKLELVRGVETEVAKKPTIESKEAVQKVLYPIIQDSQVISAEQHEALVKNIIGEIGLDEVNEIVNEIITPENLTLSLTGTEKEGAEYPTKEKLLEIYTQVQGRKLDEYVDNTINEPIMETIPTPGKIVKQTTFPKSGINKWVLSNGVTVYSKKTDFQADEVLLSANSPGGKAMLNEADYKAADMITPYSYNAGFGKFDGSALQKALAGKVVQIYPTIETYSEGWNGTCSPKDMELMFQMIHQMAHVPRFNPETFNASVSQMRSFVQNSLLNPENAFSDTLDALIFNNHPLKRDMHPQDLDNITLAQLEKVYRDRFADFSDFTFYVVGAFDEEQLRTYCTTYLANLPVLKRKDSIRNVGITTFSGIKEIRFNKGSERTFAYNVTKGKYKYSPAADANLNALMIVSNEKLRENVRENLSGVYSVQAWRSLERYPKPVYRLQTWMACDPEKVDLLQEASFATLDSLKAGTFDDKYVQVAKTTLQKRYEESIKSNRYWIANIENNVFNGKPIDAFLDNPKLYAKLDKKTVVKAAKQYLSFNKNKLSVIMLPLEN
ncbi:MAG: insulinase family protein [Candidatus Cloacimonetes bacterium]|nr:insulinase family protein [Candidatus Cloacimonadota bacterium]